MITPPRTPQEFYPSGSQPLAQSPQAAAKASFSSPYAENIHLSPETTPKDGVLLSKRILMGNKEACLTLQSIIPLDQTHLRKQIEELIGLIDRSRSCVSMSDAEYSRKVNLQSLIAESIEGSGFYKQRKD